MNTRPRSARPPTLNIPFRDRLLERIFRIVFAIIREQDDDARWNLRYTDLCYQNVSLFVSVDVPMFCYRNGVRLRRVSVNFLIEIFLRNGGNQSLRDTMVLCAFENKNYTVFRECNRKYIDF